MYNNIYGCKILQSGILHNVFRVLALHRKSMRTYRRYGFCMRRKCLCLQRDGRIKNSVKMIFETDCLCIRGGHSQSRTDVQNF